MNWRSSGNERFILSRAEENQSNRFQRSQTKQACSNSNNTPSLLSNTPLSFPRRAPLFSHSPYVHTHTLHMWGKYLAKWLAAVKQWGPVRNTGLRGSRGSRCRYMGQLCQVERSSLVFPGARGSAECEGIKTSPGLFALIIDSEARLSQHTWITDGLFSPAAEITWAHLALPSTSPGKPLQKTYCLQNSWLALPCSLPVKTQQTGSDRFLWQIPKKSFKDVFIRDYKSYKQTVSDLFTLLGEAVHENWFFSSLQIVFNDILYYSIFFFFLKTNKQKNNNKKAMCKYILE